MSFEPHKAVYEILDKGDKRMSFPNYISTDAVDYDLVDQRKRESEATEETESEPAVPGRRALKAGGKCNLLLQIP